ncbi:TetR family transcriptional regulator [Ornithinimicrobium sp. F0845]|uniref:TetR/AcrR family transcriptional regulator n=1 Tax=Ornithinimicrobium sp. F0845 TaxID=2926412 RepID=UPI001FF6725A|nr:TetR family transcriptional regulator [Ornithinimicrobium sp. F0845]MCK0113262.1 TetR family transcriptional regulator [Ornithinimicrobium sp. F0845]
MTTRRERALAAAIELLGTQGLSALTHRRIDARAELPPGSTSNYFRTRDALLTGVADAILEKDLASVGPALTPASADELLDALVALLDRTTRDQRVLTTARLVLFMEASHDPVLREALGRGRAEIETALEPVLRALGAQDPGASAGAIMACAEGLILHRIGRHDDSDVRPTLGVVLRGALA